jgi:hypothetical protein
VESPGLGWLPPTTDLVGLRHGIARALAHQWFHSLVGSDQAADPFADEAPTSHVARLLTGTLRSSTCAAGRLDLSVYEYSTDCFEERIAVEGANELERLRRKMGNAPYWTGLRSYLGAHADGFGGTGALLAAIDGATPLELHEDFRLRFPSWQ